MVLVWILVSSTVLLHVCVDFGCREEGLNCIEVGIIDAAARRPGGCNGGCGLLRM